MRVSKVDDRSLLFFSFGKNRSSDMIKVKINKKKIKENVLTKSFFYSHRLNTTEFNDKNSYLSMM